MSSRATPEQTAHALQEGLGQLFRRLRQLRGPGGLSQPESQALNRLVREPGSTSADLARGEGISAQSMGPIVASLEARGLVERQRDPGDGRRMVLVVTAAGEEQTRTKRSARAEQFATALADFSDAERATLLAAAPLLERLARTLA